MYSTIKEALRILLNADKNREYEAREEVTGVGIAGTAAEIVNDLLYAAAENGISPRPEDEKDMECWALLEYVIIMADPESASKWNYCKLFREVGNRLQMAAA